jgi:hypothetical protein
MRRSCFVSPGMQTVYVVRGPEPTFVPILVRSVSIARLARSKHAPSVELSPKTAPAARE